MEATKLSSMPKHRTSCKRRPRGVAFTFALGSASQTGSATAMHDIGAHKSSFHVCSSFLRRGSFVFPYTPPLPSIPEFSTGRILSKARDTDRTRTRIETPTADDSVSTPKPTTLPHVNRTPAKIGGNATTLNENRSSHNNGSSKTSQRDLHLSGSSQEHTPEAVREASGTRRRREFKDFYRLPVHLADNVLIYGTDSEKQACITELMIGKRKMTIEECNDVLSSLVRLRRGRDARALVRVWEQKSYIEMLVEARAVKTFTIMIDVCGKSQQLSRAYSLFHGMRKAGVSPNLVTYNSMIAACARSNEPDLAYELFEEMQKQGLQPDKFTYGSLIDSYAKAGEVEKAFQISKSMEEAGVWKDQTIYSALMDACGRAKQLERAFQVFEEMKRNGVWPNLVTFSVLIDTCANAREPEKAFQLFSEIKHWGYPKANVVVYTALIDACAKAGWPVRAELVMKSMIENDIRPNEISFGALIDSWTKEGNLDRSFTILELMVNDHGVAPNAILIGTLIDGCRRLGDYSRVKAIWAAVLKHNIRPLRCYYAALICMAAKVGDLEVASAVTLHAYARGCLRRVTLQKENPILYALGCAIVYLRHAILNDTNCSRETKEHHLSRLRVAFNSTAIKPDEMSSVDPEEAFQFCMLSPPQKDAKHPHWSQRGFDRSKG